MKTNPVVLVNKDYMGQRESLTAFSSALDGTPVLKSDAFSKNGTLIESVLVSLPVDKEDQERLIEKLREVFDRPVMS